MASQMVRATVRGQSLNGQWRQPGEVFEHDGKLARWMEPADEAPGILSALPSLTGKNKAALLVIAQAEGVAIADDATNAQIVAAIEAKREG